MLQRSRTAETGSLDARLLLISLEGSACWACWLEVFIGGSELEPRRRSAR